MAPSSDHLNSGLSHRQHDGHSELQHTVRLGQIFPLLAEAAANSRAWLTDFSDEPVRVSEDLYDVILAYQHFQDV